MPCHHPCTFTLDDGTHYDLSSLSSSSSDYITEVGDTKYNLNVCRAVVGELWKIDEPDKVGGFINGKDGDFSLGQVNSNLTLSPAGDGPILYMSNGSPCPSDPSTSASTAIHFVCSLTEFGAGQPKLVAALPPGPAEDQCQFFFEWSTHIACPTNNKRDISQHHYFYAFIALLLVAFLTWFGGVTLYNRLHLKRRGMDQFPLPSINLPSFSGLFKRGEQSGSGGGASKSGFGWRRRSQRGGAAGGGYSGIRAEEYDEDEGFAGRFSLDDDEDDDQDAQHLSGQSVEARALAGEANAWRSQGQGGGAAQPDGQQAGNGRGLVDV